MKTFLLLLLPLFLAIQAQAADSSSPVLIDEIQGVYKHRFMNGLITPGRAPGEADQSYESEDVVEIVPYDDSSIYVRADLAFYNGHSCQIAGIARYEKGAFVYHDPEPSADGAASCKLKVSLTQTELQLTDRETPDGIATCRAYCGARGSLSDYSIARSARRKIRYLPRLKASREYAQAVSAFKIFSKTIKQD